MKILIIYLFLSLPMLAYAQPCPQIVQKSGFVVISQSKEQDTERPYIRDGVVEYPPVEPDINRIMFFIPSDSVTTDRPLSYWIKRREVFPAAYVLYYERALRRVVKEKCGLIFESIDLHHDPARPKVGKNGVPLYEMAGVKKGRVYYRIYYLDALWYKILLTAQDKKQMMFGMSPPLPKEGDSPFFSLLKILDYQADAQLNDKSLIEYKLP
ncbi:hypothetical protein [Chitinophaga rhizophila]|uniref:Uncharacterized protein n=1 Tax=Chitinophaga rhizophila TaxID=2866212 RepID=A0ABS7GBH9_9BACT|nr:hypothetical protein [Chitinophaga rhizophila]MBW8684771.1 hypothetical protein [Chitinophaga rhizophila]